MTGTISRTGAQSGKPKTRARRLKRQIWTARVRTATRLLAVTLALSLLVPAAAPAVSGGVSAQDATAVSIADVQADSADGSPYESELVTTAGTVTAVADDGFFVQNGTGAYSGVYVYGSTAVEPGDVVSVTGSVEEHYGLTEIDVTEGSVATTGTASVPDPTPVDAANASSEAYEGVLVELSDLAVTAAPDEHGEWAVDDDSGSVAVDDVAAGADATPEAAGGTIDSIAGPMYYSFGAFKVQPTSVENYTPPSDDGENGDDGGNDGGEEDDPEDARQLTVLSYNDVQTAASDPTAMGRLVGAVDQRRSAVDGPTVVVGGGDQVSPSSLSPVSNWTVPVEVLNELDPAAEVVGNHDLDYGFAPVANYSAASEFPWLLANVRDGGGDPVPGTAPHSVVERGNVTVGIVGLVDEAIRSKTAVDFEERGYEVTDFVEEGARAAETLETEAGADVVIAAAHLGVPEAKELARETDRIDVVVTGDDEVAYEPQTVDGTVIVEAEARANYLGEANLTVGDDGVALESGRLVELDGDNGLSVDETAAGIVERARSEQLSTVVGRTTVPLDSTFDANYAEETGWGNVVADAFRTRAGSDAAVTNAGGIRGDFVVPPGNVTYDDVYTSLPFGNHLVTKELAGEQLRELLASQVTRLDDQYGAQAQLQVSGVTYEIVDRPDADRAVADLSVNGEPVDPDATYEVTLNSYMAGWSFEDRYGWNVADRPTVERDYTLYGTAAAEYVAANSPITSPEEDRIRRVTRSIGSGSIDVAGDTATITFDAPAAVERVDASSVRVQNATDGVVDAENATLSGDDLEVAVDASALRTLAAASDDLQLYAEYDDASLDERRNGFDQSVLNGDVPIDDVSTAPVAVQVGSTTVDHGGTAEVPVQVTAVPEGLSGGHLTIAIGDATVATVADASYGDAIELTAPPEIADDGSAVELRAADLADEVQPGDANVTLATLALHGDGTGTTDLGVEVHAIDDDAGATIDVDERPGEISTGPPPVDPSDPSAVHGSPSDPDGDGRFEDLNGNGRLDYDDVVVLFAHLDDPDVVDHGDHFDFNGNGRLDFDDVVDLYATIA